MTEPLLDIRDLRVSFAADGGKVEAVHGLSLSLQRGEILGLVGESGSGKSTVAKSVLRILGPPGIITGGQISFHFSCMHSTLACMPNFVSREPRGRKCQL